MEKLTTDERVEIAKGYIRTYQAFTNSDDALRECNEMLREERERPLTSGERFRALFG